MMQHAHDVHGAGSKREQYCCQEPRGRAIFTHTINSLCSSSTLCRQDLGALAIVQRDLGMEHLSGHCWEEQPPAIHEKWNPNGEPSIKLAVGTTYNMAPEIDY